jgi:hypothetical protein
MVGFISVVLRPTPNSGRVEAAWGPYCTDKGGATEELKHDSGCFKCEDASAAHVPTVR